MHPVMDLRATKLELIEMLLQTEKESVLQQIKEILENASEHDWRLTPEDYEMIDARRKRHLEGKSSSFSWEEVKNESRKIPR